MSDWPPELREKAREAFWERKDADPDERLLDALDAIADDVVLKRDLRPDERFYLSDPPGPDDFHERRYVTPWTPVSGIVDP